MSAVAAKTNGRGPRVPLTVPPAPEPERHEAGPTTPNLDAAVLRVQAAAPTLIRDAVGQIGSRTYGYVTNDQVVDAVLPLLVAEGLLWKTRPTIHDGQPALRYTMTHVASGESEEDVMPLMLDAQTSQALGSAITYDRRYSLTAYLNLTVDPDDDGRAATTQGGNSDSAQNSAQNNGQTAAPSATPAKRTERRRTAKQQTMLEAKARAAGLGSSEFANVILVAADDPPRNWSDENHADQTLRRLLDQLPARLVDAVIAGIAGARP